MCADCRLLADPVQIDLQRGQRLTELVVKLPRHTRAVLFTPGTRPGRHAARLFVRFFEPFLGFAAHRVLAGDVAQDREMEAWQHVRHGTELDVVHGAVARAQTVPARHAAFLQELVPAFAGVAGRCIGREIPDVQLQDAVAIATEQRARGGIRLDVLAGVVRQQDRIQGVVEQRLETPPAVEQRFLQAEMFRHVGDDDEVRLPAFQDQGSRRHFDLEHLAAAGLMPPPAPWGRVIADTRKFFEEDRPLGGRPDVGDRHPQELVAGEPVPGNCRLVDTHETKRHVVENPGGQRNQVEEGLKVPGRSGGGRWCRRHRYGRADGSKRALRSLWQTQPQKGLRSP